MQLIIPCTVVLSAAPGCRHIGVDLTRAQIAAEFARLNSDSGCGSGFVSFDQFCVWASRICSARGGSSDGVSSESLEGNSAACPAVQLRTPSLHEIDELESVYAQFVRTAPAVATGKQRKTQGRAAADRVAASTWAVEPWGTTDGDDLTLQSMLEFNGGRSKQSVRRRAGDGCATAGSEKQSRLVRSLVSPPRPERRSRNRQSGHSESSRRNASQSVRNGGELSVRMRSLVSPPRERAKPRGKIWNPNSRPAQNERFTMERKAEKKHAIAGKDTPMNRALREQLSRWHPAFTGTQSVHESLHSLHEQRQQRMDQLRRDIEKAREEAELVVCRPWNAGRLSSPERKIPGAKNMAQRSSDWLQDKAQNLEEKRLLIAHAHCRPSKQDRKADHQEIEDTVNSLNDWNKARLKRLEQKRKKIEAEERGSFTPTISSKSKSLVREQRGVETLLRWQKQRAEKIERSRQNKDQLELEGLFVPNRARAILQSPERSRKLNSPERRRTASESIASGLGRSARKRDPDGTGGGPKLSSSGDLEGSDSEDLEAPAVRPARPATLRETLATPNTHVTSSKSDGPAASVGLHTPTGIVISDDACLVNGRCVRESDSGSDSDRQSGPSSPRSLFRRTGSTGQPTPGSEVQAASRGVKGGEKVSAKSSANGQQNDMATVETGAAVSVDYASQQIDGAARAARNEIDIEAARLKDSISHFRETSPPPVTPQLAAGRTPQRGRALTCAEDSPSRPKRLKAWCLDQQAVVYLSVTNGQLCLFEQSEQSSASESESDSARHPTQSISLQNIVDIFSDSDSPKSELAEFRSEFTIELTDGATHSFLVEDAADIEGIEESVISGIHELSSSERAGWLASVGAK
eukprot:SAG11_NODE_1528_length_4739_cov_2.858190_2_plen_863_part_00